MDFVSCFFFFLFELCDDSAISERCDGMPCTMEHALRPLIQQHFSIAKNDLISLWQNHKHMRIKNKIKTKHERRTSPCGLVCSPWLSTRIRKCAETTVSMPMPRQNSLRCVSHFCRFYFYFRALQFVQSRRAITVKITINDYYYIFFRFIISVFMCARPGECAQLLVLPVQIFIYKLSRVLYFMNLLIIIVLRGNGAGWAACDVGNENRRGDELDEGRRQCSAGISA